MANQKYININYPFKNSPKGFYVDLTETDETAIKADLVHLLMTQKGERYYLPDLGTDLLKYIFQPNDTQTLSAIKDEISVTVQRYLPNLNINEITVERLEDERFEARVRIDYTITEDVFNTTDFVIITI